MPNQQEQHNNEEEPGSLSILQINLNKSEKAHLDLLNEELSSKYDIILIQEPYTTAFNGIRMPFNFRPVYPINRFQDDAQIRAVTWVNTKLDTKGWVTLDIPDTNDITAIQLKGPYGKLAIFNIYNDCTHARNETVLNTYVRRHANTLLRTENHHMIWAGDFNRHHPLWDRDEDIHLFTRLLNTNTYGNPARTEMTDTDTEDGGVHGVVKGAASTYVLCPHLTDGAFQFERGRERQERSG